MPLLEGASRMGYPLACLRSVCCVNVDGRYTLRNVPKTDSGVYPLVAHVRRSTRLSLRFSPAGQRSRVKYNRRKEGETGNEATMWYCTCKCSLAQCDPRALNHKLPTTCKSCPTSSHMDSRSVMLID